MYVGIRLLKPATDKYARLNNSIMRNFLPAAFVLVVISLVYGCATATLSKNNQRKLAGKTIVIIGASSGLGKGAAIQLAEYRANVVIAAPREDLLNEVAKEIRNAGGNVLVVPMDISKPEDIQRLADATLKQYGKIDVWMNNAGVGAIEC